MCSNINKVQDAFFSLLNDCFKRQLTAVRDAGGNTKRGVLNWASGKYEDEIIYFTKRRLEDIYNFWKLNHQSLKEAIVSSDCLPIYSISRPTFFKDQIVSAGLYCDFFVYHDDSIAGMRNFDALAKEKLTALSLNLLRDFMEILSIQPVFITGDGIPLAVICPGERDIDDEITPHIIKRSALATIAYSNDLLGTRFETWEELEAGTKETIGSEAIRKAIKRPELLPSPFFTTSNTAERLNQCFQRLRTIQGQSQANIPKKASLYNLIINFLTEFGVIEGQLHGSLEIDSAPLLPRYTWDLYKWRISSGNNDSSKLMGWAERYSTGVATSLQHEDLDWLCNIPLDSLLELRRTGFLEDFRQSLRKSRRKMTIEESVDFEKISQEIQHDIENAIQEHQALAKQLEHEAHERIGLETTKFLGKLWFGLASCAAPILSLVELISDGAEYITKLKGNLDVLKTMPEKYRRGSWGLLMEAKNKQG